jgi:hypothetical protein
LVIVGYDGPRPIRPVNGETALVEVDRHQPVQHLQLERLAV